MWFTLPILCYLIGSIPVSLIAGKISRGVDIREIGSGNAGATNSYRELGLITGIIVLLFDVLKALIPLLFIKLYLEKNNIPSELVQRELLMVICLSLVITGHVFPVFAKFKGGKAVASGAGGITAVIPILSPLCLIVFLLTATITRYISLASIFSAWSLSLFYTGLVLLKRQDFSLVFMIYFILIGMIITLLHRKNIRSLINGSERKISKFSKNH
ncbi:glycerol-3-phosphate 1-O-acyltransferase PlsY [Oceanispirochaeta sp. M2]|nr:glycerol-3-phosphate 1-O-acyltransferase PlsY [Oceanispirochaeta sp. M2]NPD71219.1 glycerol-3-phosphate 1-O-acyltransferase PlsY [Oceanispirochaeta sp. M1]RDG33691.1 glycerol-3-phosphate 1-O-acyltransferase [Oceanispirochaeta sp. M1]